MTYKSDRTYAAASRRLVCAAACAILLCGGCAATRPDIRQSPSTDSASRLSSPREANLPVIEGELNLQDALRLAMKHANGIQAALLERDIAEGRLQETRGNALPSLDANAAYTRLDEASSFDVGGRLITMGFEDNYSAGLNVRVPVSHGGAIRASMNMARLQALMADEQMRQAVQDTVAAVSKSYLDTLLSDSLIRVHGDALKSAERHLAEAESRRKQQAGSEYDVLRAQVDAALARAELIRQKGEHEAALTYLLRTIGVSQDSTVILTEQPDFRPAKPALEQAMKIARLNSPEVLRAEMGVEMQRQALRIARSAFWPQVDALLSQKWSNPDPHSPTADEWGGTWSAGAVLTLPVFQGGSLKGRVIQEKARLKQAELRLADAEQNTVLDLKQSVLDLLAAEELVESQQMNVERAREGLRLAEAGYAEQIRTAAEVADARTALTRAHALRHQAVHAHSVARIRLQRAMGILGPGGLSDSDKPANPPTGPNTER